MDNEIIIKVGKPESDQEIQSFKEFRMELKEILKTGKIKVVEKFRDFTFTLTDCTSDERQRVSSFIKENKTMEFIH